MSVKFANNAHSTLASSLSTSATSITVASGHGARFPSLSSGEYFYATLIDTSNNLEIVKVTARSTDVLTATRAQESTSARAFASGDRIELRVTAQGLVDLAVPAADSIVNSMIATDAVNADSIVANAVTAAEINVTGNGTSGQALLSDGDGSFSYGAAGRTLGVTKFTANTRTALPSQDIYDFFDTNVTQVKAGSKFVIHVHLLGFGASAGAINHDLIYDGTTHTGAAHYAYTGQSYGHTLSGLYYIDGASSAGAKNFKFRYDHASSTGRSFTIWNPNASDDARLQQTVSTIIFIEYDL